MTNALKFKSVGRSDVGLTRDNNEDSGFIGKNFLLVADGMGGHAAGELASSTAVSVIANFDKNFQKFTPQDIVNKVSEKIKTSIGFEAQFPLQLSLELTIEWYLLYFDQKRKASYALSHHRS